MEECKKENEGRNWGLGREGGQVASKDPAVRFTTTVEIKREEALQRASHRPMLAARNTLAEDPGMSKRALMTRAKSAMAK